MLTLGTFIPWSSCLPLPIRNLFSLQMLALHSFYPVPPTAAGSPQPHNLLSPHQGAQLQLAKGGICGAGLTGGGVEREKGR